MQAILRHEPALWDQPLALVDSSTGQPAVYEVTTTALAAGVSPGLTPTQAMARCGHVLFRSRDQRQEEAATQAIRQRTFAFSPHLEGTGPGVCTLDLRGLACLRDATRSELLGWGANVQLALAGLGLSAAIGLAATPTLAWHAARWGNGLTLIDEPVSFVRKLPMQALNPSSEIAEVLGHWGIRTVGELLDLGQEDLTARLGIEGLALLAAASVEAVRPLHCIQPSETYEEVFDFEPGIETLEPLLFILRRLVSQLTERLQPRGLVAETVRLHLQFDSGHRQNSRLRLPQPTCDPGVLFRLLHSHLENVRAEAPLKVVILELLPTEQPQKQLGLFEAILPDPHEFNETLARLSAILGTDRVGSPTLESSHRPDQFKLVPPEFENLSLVEETKPFRIADGPPLRRFRPPVHAEVVCEPAVDPRPPTDPSSGQAGTPSARESPKGGVPPWQPSPRPISIRCALVQGRLRIVVGPWRSSGNWWGPDAWIREEWDAATSDGYVIRLVHQADGWFVEGLFD
ncbi:MAG: DNA polymerase Y family protein [Verrucomicrobiota bacterium]